MLDSILFPDEYNLKIESISIENQVIVVVISSSSASGICPYCQRASHRVHSFYQRQPADLPFVAHPVRLMITVRRFFCDNNDCERTIFAERMPALLEPYARRTNRLIAHLRHVAFALGGKAGARLLLTQGIPVSPDTLLRIIKNAPEPEVKAPRVLGIDDWAQKKGHSYGTILIDLENRKPVDLLPDRKAASVEAWLKAHPGVEIISRDRGTEYIKGATSGAPDANQVADRWHLLKNLRENLARWLETKPDCLRAAARNEVRGFTRDVSKQDEPEQEKSSSTSVENLEQSPEPSTEQPPEVSSKQTRVEEQKLAIRKKRQERYEAVKELHEQGLTNSEISRHLHLDRKTVRKYIKAKSCPMYPEGRIRASKLDPYKEYITKRFKEGCTNATKILAEIRQLGYSGSKSVMMEWVKKALRPSHSKATNSSQNKVVQKTIAPWTARRASWLLVKNDEELREDEQQALERMQKASGKVNQAYSLSQRFCRMIKERSSSSLLPWLEEAKKSGIDALKQFAKGITQDIDAVTNALRYEWSNGQVEGQVNRLKLIKRQMYGRANFDLLRKRVLFNPI